MAQEKQELLDHYGAPIASFLEDPEVNEIMVERYNQIRIERRGVFELTEARWRDEQDLVQYIKQVGRALGQVVDEKLQPILDARFDNGTRFNAVMRPIAVFGPTVSIRPFPKRLFTIDDLEQRGASTPAMRRIFEAAIERRLTIVVSGGTGSGKTTWVRALCSFIPEDERVLTVEDTAENLMPNHRHVEAFEAAKRRTEKGALEVTMGLLIENALRRRPDRIIVGEIRKPEAAAAFIDAVNTGHDGSISTIHANSALDALPRVEILYARQATNFSMDVIREFVRNNLNLIVHAVREPNKDGLAPRRIKQIVWVDAGVPRNLIHHVRGRGYVTELDAVNDFENFLSA